MYIDSQWHRGSFTSVVQSSAASKPVKGGYRIVYYLSDDATFIRTIIEAGRNLHASNEGRNWSNDFCPLTFSANLGSNYKIIIKFSPANYSLTENLYNDLLSCNEEINLNLGFYSTIIGHYVHKCLIAMKHNDLA